jgi:hypothetical protein
MYRLALVVMFGCTPTSFAFTPSVRGVTPKPDSCNVEVVTSPPSRDFQELGTLDFYNGTEPKTLDAFKKAVDKQVCHVGGDAVIAIADDKGHYTKGTVITYSDSGAPARAQPSHAVPEQQPDSEVPKAK